MAKTEETLLANLLSGVRCVGRSKAFKAGLVCVGCYLGIGPGKLPVRLTRADRQHDRERRAAVGIVGSPDFAAVAFDDGATDRKPNPQAVGLARDEGVEDGLEFFRGDPRAAVLQFDQDV